MGKFNVCARVARAGGHPPSHAWIALHRCVEANARLTGEPFGVIFARLERAHRFGRAPDRWPDAACIRVAVDRLQAERDAFLAELNARAQARRAEKRAGLRENRDARLTQLCEQQAAHHVPTVGYWGWRRRRAGR
jgi:hypothetical protein